jgi:hypothetical protein
MTFKEAFYMNKQIQFENALKIDIQVKCAGGKEGFKGMDKALNDYNFEELAVEYNTNEATIQNVAILDMIKKQTKGNVNG